MNALKLTLQRMGYTSHPLPEADLGLFEHALGVRLPSGYREFLVYVGHGAGPHTLWTPESILDELRLTEAGQQSVPGESDSLRDRQMLLEASGILEDLEGFLGGEGAAALQKEVLEYEKQHPGTPLPSQPFHFTRAQAEAYNHSVPEESVQPWLFGLYPASGCIPIADDGGVVYYVLAVTGDVAGSVWEVAGDPLTAWRPARRPQGLPGVWAQGRNPLPALSATPSFLEWYCSWVEQLLVDLCPDPGSYLNLALQYQEIGEYATAVENWDKAIQRASGNSLAYYYRGLALQGLQQGAKAAVDFERCLAQNPDPWTEARAREQLRTSDAR